MQYYTGTQIASENPKLASSHAGTTITDKITFCLILLLVQRQWQPNLPTTGANFPLACLESVVEVNSRYRTISIEWIYVGFSTQLSGTLQYAGFYFSSFLLLKTDRMNGWCFRSQFCTVKAILNRGQPGLMRLILLSIMPQVQHWSLVLLTCSPVRYQCARDTLWIQKTCFSDTDGMHVP